MTSTEEIIKPIREKREREKRVSEVLDGIASEMEKYKEKAEKLLGTLKGRTAVSRFVMQQLILVEKQLANISEMKSLATLGFPGAPGLRLMEFYLSEVYKTDGDNLKKLESEVKKCKVEETVSEKEIKPLRKIGLSPEDIEKIKEETLRSKKLCNLIAEQSLATATHFESNQALIILGKQKIESMFDSEPSA